MDILLTTFMQVDTITFYKRKLKFQDTLVRKQVQDEIDLYYKRNTKSINTQNTKFQKQREIFIENCRKMVEFVFDRITEFDQLQSLVKIDTLIIANLYIWMSPFIKDRDMMT